MKKLLLILTVLFAFTFARSQDITEIIAGSNASGDSFPQIITTVTGGDYSAGTSAVITFPEGAAVGNLISFVISCDANQTFSVSSGTGWTIETQINESFNAVAGCVVWKILDGSGDNLTIAWDNGSQETSWVGYRITGFDTEDPMTVTSADGGLTTNFDPPANTGLGGALDYLWIVAGCADEDIIATAAPTDFSDLLTANGGGAGGSTVSTATREYNTGDAYNPGAFTSANIRWVSFTIIINP